MKYLQKKTMKYLYDKLKEKVPDLVMEKILDLVITAAISGLAPYVPSWCWSCWVQEMRRIFEGILFWAKRVNPTAQQSNTTNLQVQQLVRELQHEAQQGIELLDGQPTPVNLSNAQERIKRILEVALELDDLLLRNEREAGVHPGADLKVSQEIKQLQFKPRYLHRPTRFQVIRGYKYY